MGHGGGSPGSVAGRPGQHKELLKPAQGAERPQGIVRGDDVPPEPRPLGDGGFFERLADQDEGAVFVFDSAR